MKIRDSFEILEEAPLPDDWDSDKFIKGRMKHSELIDYVSELAKEVGQGSSRVAFEIPYQGRTTVIKVAKNAAGEAQNRAEAAILSNARVQSTNMVIPLIDYDTKNSRPMWIHVERAFKTDSWELDRLFEDQLDALLVAANTTRNFTRWKTTSNKHIRNFIRFAEIVRDRIEWVDLDISENWGIYKGRPIVVDAGLTKGVYTKHYGAAQVRSLAFATDKRRMANKPPMSFVNRTAHTDRSSQYRREVDEIYKELYNDF